MAILDMESHRKKGAIRGRESRNQTVTTKLTEAELAEVETVSEAEGKSPGEWLRDAALRAARGEDVSDKTVVLLAEIVGVRLLLVNVLGRLAAGEKLVPETFEKLLDEISQAKYQLADKLLAQREGK